MMPDQPINDILFNATKKKREKQPLVQDSALNIAAYCFDKSM